MLNLYFNNLVSWSQLLTEMLATIALQEACEKNLALRMRGAAHRRRWMMNIFMHCKTTGMCGERPGMSVCEYMMPGHEYSYTCAQLPNQTRTKDHTQRF